MKKALKVSDLIQTEEKQSKDIEFTHELKTVCGWAETWVRPQETIIKNIVYLGVCSVDGDIFAVYIDDTIRIFKGFLNDGTY